MTDSSGENFPGWRHVLKVFKVTRFEVGGWQSKALPLLALFLVRVFRVVRG
jgi:hypothetical protein